MQMQMNMNRQKPQPTLLQRTGIYLASAALAFSLAAGPARAAVTAQNTAATGRQPITLTMSRPEGLFSTKLVLSDGILTGEEYYTIASGRDTFTLQLTEKGDNIDGRLYAACALNDTLKIGAGAGNDFWGIAALGTYADGRYAIVYTETGPKRTFAGSIDRRISSDFNLSLKASETNGNSPTFALGGDLALGNGGQFGLSSKLGSWNEISVYLSGTAPWGGVRLDAVNLGRDDTMWSMMINLNTR
ncbi:Uncharacterised protein [Candidatus Burarchaeum australiense]|nr:Uncharacterised protein [Candidatus Burarchaeum australiense]